MQNYKYMEQFSTIQDKDINTDWLINNSAYKAGIYRAKQTNEIIIDNNLIRRTFRLTPNAATVGFDNLITNQSIIRGIKPEALIEIDGTMYEVGGLKGQKNYAFLRPEWIDELKENPKAFKFTGFKVGKPEERIAWKRVRHHDTRAKWPPKGIYLRMDYKLPELTETFDKASEISSKLGRKSLIFDEFKELTGDWQLQVSETLPRNAFENEGRIGEILSYANTAVFAERKLPKNVKVVEVKIDAGTDVGASWGAGIALVWSNRVIKLNLRPGGDEQEAGIPVFGTFDGQKENPAAGGRKILDISKPWTLRLRIDGNMVYCEAKPSRGNWKTYETMKLPTDTNPPLAVRIGKMSLKGTAEDYHIKGDFGRTHILRFAAYGEIDKSMLEDETKNRVQNRDLVVSVHYELYDGIPVMSKWITVQNNSNREIKLNSFTSEILSAVEYSSDLENRIGQFDPPNIHVETDYAFGSMVATRANRFSVRWVTDPDYKSQVDYGRQNPCMLQVGPMIGPDQEIKAGESFESFHAFVMPYDSYDRERNGLALRKMYRTIAPWITENPLMMHVRFSDWETVKYAIDQCAEVGFEMVILTFYSGFDIEDDSDQYIAKMKKYADYANKKGIEIGGYSLLASRDIDDENNVIMPPGQRPTFGYSPCLQSEWGHDYFRKLYQFYEKTGFTLLEHDGSYPGDICISKNHPGHKGVNDSRWKQWKTISNFYKWCRAKGIYLNVPDCYYLAGSNKTAMGYREMNWALPRNQQLIHTRQNIFDGTWVKTSSMGWMFVPLTSYKGGGTAATIEPLNEHSDHYEQMVASSLGAGVQACYRGPRLFDTNKTKAMVKKWIDWYKRHREVLEGDIIHLRRADARDIDYLLNVNPSGKEKGLLMVYNPLNHKVSKIIKVPLYYTGLTKTANIRKEDGKTKKYELDRDYSVDLPVDVAANKTTWFVIK